MTAEEMLERALRQFFYHGRDEDLLEVTLEEVLAAARQEGREEAAKVAEPWLGADTMQMRAGEMTAGEKRTVKAVVSSILAAIRAIKETGDDPRTV